MNRTSALTLLIRFVVIATKRLCSKTRLGFIPIILCVMFSHPVSQATGIKQISTPVSFRNQRAQWYQSNDAQFRNLLNRRIALSGVRDLFFDDFADSEFSSQLPTSEAQPLALAASDFDEDGTPDIICGFATSTGGKLTLHKGNVDAVFPNHPEAQLGKMEGIFSDAPFLAKVTTFATNEAPEFLATGDFNADGHIDLVIANRNSNVLHFLLGDGQGNLYSELAKNLPGYVTALVSGDVNRRNGLADLVIGTRSSSGAKLLIFESIEGAMNATPEEMNFPSAVSALTIAELNGDALMDIAVAAGKTVSVIAGHNRDWRFKNSAISPSLPLEVYQHTFDCKIRSIVSDQFHQTRGRELALLTEDGSIYICEKSPAKANPLINIRVLASRQFPTANHLISAPVSSHSPVNLMVLDSTEDKLQVMASDEINENQPNQQINFESDASCEIAFASKPIAVLPMRLNNDGLSDLVILREGKNFLSVAPSAPQSVFTVTNTNDSGAGSLRQAINNANVTAGADVIIFNIAIGPQSIALLSPLPSLSETVAIDATTQIGFAGNPIIELNGAGAGAGASGLTVSASNCTVQGLVINRFSAAGITITNITGSIIQNNFIGTNLSGNAAIGNFIGVGLNGALNSIIGGTTSNARNIISGNLGDGIALSGDATFTQIQGNFIGLDVTGTLAIPNVNGVQAFNSGNNLIGGTSAGVRNIISGNSAEGVFLSGALASGNLVQGNFIGTNASGNAAISNNLNGIRCDAVTENTIGGNTSTAGNLISGNPNGIVLLNNAANTFIQNNRIGTQANGIAALPNTKDGVAIVNSSNNTINSNIIAFNNDRGVNLLSGTSNLIQNNSIFSNNALGIDLNNDGLTANDAGDPDAGANTSQNFPVITSVTLGVSSTTIIGSLNSTPNSTFQIDFYSNTACDPSGNGEGQRFIGSTNVLTDAAGNAPINASFPVVVSLTSVVTATAIDSLANTSEFSECTVVTVPPCDIICSPGMVVSASENQCGTVVNYPLPTVVGVCLTITCTPPTGSVFNVGNTQVDCISEVGPSCSFFVTVVDQTPPTITCPQNITQLAESGKASAVVNYSLPTPADNCPNPTINCTPPSGTAFPLGITGVVCQSRDQSNNLSTCAFSIIVTDNQSPIIQCPPNQTVNAASGQTSATVTYPAPQVSDIDTKTTVTCVPPSGSSFALGITIVTCTATDSGENKASCSFTVTVIGGTPTLSITPQPLIFGVPTPLTVKRKPIKEKNLSCQAFTIENRGFVSLTLSLESIMRIGADVTNRKITDPSEGNLYSITQVNADGSQSILPIGTTMAFAIGQRRNFCLRINPVIPAVTTIKTGLSAPQALPDVINSQVNFRIVGGGLLTLNVTAQLSTKVILINGNNPRLPAETIFERAGDEFIVTYSAYDSNLDVNKTRYEFLDANGNLVGNAIEVDLRQFLSDANLVRGQSFTVIQRFSGAQSNPQVASARVTVFDAETNATSPLTTMLQSQNHMTWASNPFKITPINAEIKNSLHNRRKTSQNP
ncbi:MAG: HYR domain-containing protein [Acidobacteriota bacterium]